MKIAVISDIHENYHNLFQTLEKIESQSVEKILCLGDLISPNIAIVLAASKIPVHSIWGNNEADKAAIVKNSLHPKSNLTITNNVYDELEIDERNIFMTHFPDIAQQMAASGKYDVVFFGHVHKKSKEVVGKCLLVNPGEIAALRTGKASYVVYDTEKKEVEFFDVDDVISTKTKEDGEKFQEAKNKLS